MHAKNTFAVRRSIIWFQLTFNITKKMILFITIYLGNEYQKHQLVY